jgi:hypothetical protein
VVGLFDILWFNDITRPRKYERQECGTLSL